MNADDLIALNEQIAGMARAGLPLDQGLAGLAKDMSRGRLKAVTQAIADDLRAGSTLPESIERRRGELPPYYANLVTAGVRTGRLPEVLATLTTYARTLTNTRIIVIDAMFYPVVVVLFAAALLVVLVFKVLPEFSEIFRGFQMKLPAVTEAILFVGEHPIPCLVVPLAVVFLGPLLLRFIFGLSTAGRITWAKLVYSVPGIGSLIRSARLAAFSDLLAVLVEFEMPLPEAFRLAGEASSDPLTARRAGAIRARLDQGLALGEALHGGGLLPEWVAWMAGAGDRRGNLAPTLRQIAALYRRQVESRAALLRTVMPSFVIIVTAGTLTGAFAMAIMLPMFKLLEGLSK